MNVNKNFLLLKGASVYNPTKLGEYDIFIAYGKIACVDKEIVLPSFLKDNTQVFDLSNHVITPGFIDPHVHVTGGGGEDGPKSRAHETKIHELLDSGITSVIGVLGTDSISRSLENLLFKIKSLNEQGLNAWMYTGSYKVPTLTLTGTIMRDLTLIKEIIGIKTALEDHRSSYPTLEEITKVSSETRVGGMLGSKPGIVHVHMGSGKNKLDLLWKLLDNTDIPISQFLPTHMFRTEQLIDESKNWLQKGGFIDVTASTKVPKILDVYKKNSIPLNITLSSDAYGSAPKFDNAGKLSGMKIAESTQLIEILKTLITTYNWELSDILPFYTTNPAKIFNFTNKGKIEENYDADILVFDKEFNIRYVISRGKLLKSPNWTYKGYFS